MVKWIKKTGPLFGLVFRIFSGNIGPPSQQLLLHQQIAKKKRQHG